MSTPWPSILSTPATLYAGTLDARRLQEHQRRGELDGHQHGPDQHHCPRPGDRSRRRRPRSTRHGERGRRCLQEHQRRGELDRHQHRPDRARVSTPWPSIPSARPRSTPARPTTLRRLQEHRRRGELDGHQHRPDRPCTSTPWPSILRRRPRSTPGPMAAASSRAPTAGESWSPINTGLTDTGVQALAIDPSAPATLYAGTLVGGVFKSTNGGGSWTTANTGMKSICQRPGHRSFGADHPLRRHVTPMAASSRAPTAGGAGRPSTPSTPSSRPWPLILRRRTPSTPAPHLISIMTTPGVYKSTDGGANWTESLGVLRTGFRLRPGDRSFGAGHALCRDSQLSGGLAGASSRAPTAGGAGAPSTQVCNLRPTLT